MPQWERSRVVADIAREVPPSPEYAAGYLDGFHAGARSAITALEATRRRLIAAEAERDAANAQCCKLITECQHA